MAKSVRNILISVFGIFALLFAGFFFVGCDVDYSKIALTSQTKSIELDVGKSTDVYFKIENYQSGFDNKISVNALKSDNEQVEIFSVSEPTYVSDDQIKMTVTGVAGGRGTLYVKTNEAQKECFIDIFVTQYSNTMSSNGTLMYVSNNTNFDPTDSMFEFDAHTTYKELSHYYFTPRSDFNFNTYSIENIDFEDGIVSFIDGNQNYAEALIRKFDKVELDKENNENCLYLNLAGDKQKIDLVSSFYMMTIYDYSLNNDSFSKVIYDISTVVVLPSLDVSVSGGYYVNGGVDFAPLEDERIVVVPNNSDMKRYIIRIDFLNDIDNKNVIEFSKNLSANAPINVDPFDYETDEDSDNVLYFEVSHLSPVQCEEDFSFNIFYNVAQSVEDGDVNCTLNFVGEIQIAPQTILVNGQSEPDEFFLYSNSVSGYGYQDFLVEISSNLNVEADYDGIYFEFDENKIDLLTSKGVPVVEGVLYTDLTESFRMKGKDNASGISIVKIILQSDILPVGEEITLDLDCNIIEGASGIQIETEYQSGNMFLDLNGGVRDFSNVLYADKNFQSVTTRRSAGEDVVDIEVDEIPCIHDDASSKYYLNLRVKGKAVGTGTYIIFLDNGVNKEITFEVIRVLSEKTTSLSLDSEGNGAVKNASYSEKDDAGFNNLLKIEILNEASTESVNYGSSAYIQVYANYLSKSYVEPENSVVSILGTSNGFRFVTTKNGDSTVEIVLSGNAVTDDFKRESKTISLWVNVCSYSLLSEFYAENLSDNGGVVYYSLDTNKDIDASDSSATFGIVAKNSSSFGFYKYDLASSLLQTLYEEDDDSESSGEMAKRISSTDINKEFVEESFDKKFVYYYAEAEGRAQRTKTTVTIVKVTDAGEDEKTFTLEFSNGLMFFGYGKDEKEKNVSYSGVDKDGNACTFYICYTNFFLIGSNYGAFNTETLTYTSIYYVDGVDEKITVRRDANLTFISNVEQRNLNKRYNINLSTQKFESVSGITLASSVANLDFSSNKLSYTLGVYLYPTYATNKDVNIDIVKTNGNTYDLIDYTISETSNGVYTIEISCEKFYEKYKNTITEIDCSLTSVIYIYPNEWGNSYTSIKDKELIQILVHYRNGSKANPYLLETAEDVVGINNNEVSLRSFYELASTIDLTSIKNFKPIGILNGEVVGFSGAIVGSTSSAIIKGINISNDSFVGEVGGRNYYGLFARINRNSTIENASFEGKFDVSSSDGESYAGLVCAENLGRLINVSATVKGGTFTTNAVLYFGGVVGQNNGVVAQDFAKYAGTFVEDASSEYIDPNVYNFGYNFKKHADIFSDDDGFFVLENGVKIPVDEQGFEINELGQRMVFDDSGNLLSSAWNYAGKVSKNVAYFNDFVEIVADNQNAILYVGGIAGKSVGQIRRHTDSGFKVYGYSLYTAISKIKVSGQALYVSLGGAVGRVERPEISYTDGSAIITPYVLDNLLVGGEVSSSECVCGFSDYVGGIVGYVEEQEMAILKNTSRVFVRGSNCVGGIAGFENYNNNVLVVWGNDDNINKIEAVDDGRTAFDAAMIIRYSPSSVRAQSALGDSDQYYYAVGRTGSTGRSNADGSFSFAAYSYLSNRTKIESGSVNIDNASTKAYYGDCLEYYGNAFTCHFLKRRSADISFTGNDNKLTASNGEEYSVYFLYYYQAKGLQNGDASVDLNDALSSLNKISSNQENYPFKTLGENVSISSVDSNILSIDHSQTIVVSGTGIASISLSSILDVNIRQQVYFYIVNYFNKDVKTSIFYTSPSLSGLNVTNGSLVNIFGNSNTSVYVVPSYSLANSKDVDGQRYSISDDGILSFKNVNYVLASNSYLSANADVVVDNETSNVQINKQMIIFSREDGADPEYQDEYNLTPVLKVSIPMGNENVEFYYLLTRAMVRVYVGYKERATRISPLSTSYLIKTNEVLQDSIEVETTNENEKLFYQIYKIEDGEDVLIQNKMPQNRAEVSTYNIRITEKDLFDLQFVRSGNIFNFELFVNSNSKEFTDRFNNPIYGNYRVVLYASELLDGVSSSFMFTLEEASVSYVNITNHSNINSVAFGEEVIVPSQTGLLEIVIDPVEAVFDTITISNNYINSNAGAGIAEFQFAYERSDNGVISYVPVSTFALTTNGKITFKYQDIISFIERNEEYGAIAYKGKVYVAYFLPSYNVEDGVEIAFDVSVVYGNGTKYVETGSISLITKLLSYARLAFRDKAPLGEDYYVARGLEYTLDLETYGFTRDQVTITTSDETVANVSYVNGVYTLNITSAVLSYPSDKGYHIEILTSASKVVDDVEIKTSSMLSVYVMEYVLNYAYVEGVNEDIVKGMENGVIREAIGNPYTLEIDSTAFIEYDKSNSTVCEEVEGFLNRLTNGMSWKVYLNKTQTQLSKNLKYKTEYYSIDGFVVTPLKIYNAQSNIYHFSAGLNYTIGSGVYNIATESSATSYKMYTEFSFEVYDQSTEESPIPVETYEDLLAMQDGQWYILMNDIILPGAEYAQIQEIEQFRPISKNIAGFDGNGHNFVIYGTYDFEESNIGVFSSIPQNAVFKNINVQIASSVVFNVSSSTFNVGLLAAQNNGVITNSSSSSVSGATVSVVSANTSSESNVSGLVANNSGFITNSRVSVNIFTNVNLAGFVAENGGVISSSFFKNASLKNQTDTTSSFTAGFVLTNTGKIHTSYVSGDVSSCSNDCYYSGSDNVLTSNYRVSGFAYTNTGDISDCYSNIKIVSGAESSGFVFQNSKNISRCFSTSALTNNQTSNYGFAKSNTINGERGVIEDCFYLKDEEVGINSSVGEITDAVINSLSISDFANLDKFKNYVVSRERDISSVWFFNNGNSTEYFNGAIFNSGRIELVAPNIIATSIQILDHVETLVDPETGATYAEYIYEYSVLSAKPGTIYNPFVIYNAKSMERYITQQNDSLNHNKSHYRIVCDVDYEDYQYNSKLYKTIFMGYLEGNFMTISGIVSASNEILTDAGLFAGVGFAGDSSSIGTVMNLTIIPSVVSFSNASVVGGLAGRVENGTIVNINFETASENEVVLVDGKNIVGGVVGLAVGDYLIKNIKTEICARATRQNTASNNFVENASNFDDYSFAGGVVGVASGTGTLYGVEATNSIYVLGDKAGLVVGFVDERVTTEKVYLDMSYGHSVSAYTYGGLVVGESKGTLKNIKVVGNGSNFTGFSKIMSIPIAVGGVVGLANGGEISDVYISQSIKTTDKTTDDGGISYLGGVVGQMSANTNLHNIEVVDNVILSGREYVGGVVGFIDDGCGIIYATGINVSASMSVSGRNVGVIGIGGFAGCVGTGDIISLTDGEFEISRISAVSFVYNMGVTVYAGAVFGLIENEGSHVIDHVSSGVNNTSISIYNMSIQTEQENREIDENTMFIRVLGTQNTNSDSKDKITFSIPKQSVEAGYTFRFILCV